MEGDRRFIPPVPKLSGHKAAPLRTLYRLLAVRYSPPSGQEGRSAWLHTLQSLAGYRHRSEWSLRSLAARVLADPTADTLIKVTVQVPHNERLGQALCDALPGLQEAVVIPSLPDLSAVDLYLGMAAAQIFGPHLRAGQGIGFSGGRAVASLANALSLPLQKGSPVRLYALTRFRGQEVLGITAEGVVAELVTRHFWQNLGEIPLPQECPVLALLDPTQVSPTDLDWAFVGLGALLAGEVLVEFPAACGFDWEWAQRMGVVAELLFHPFCADGLPPARPPRWLIKVDTVPLTVLQTMVRANKPVVILAGAKGKPPLCWRFIGRNGQAGCSSTDWSPTKIVPASYCGSWIAKQCSYQLVSDGSFTPIPDGSELVSVSLPSTGASWRKNAADRLKPSPLGWASAATPPASCFRKPFKEDRRWFRWKSERPFLNPPICWT